MCWIKETSIANYLKREKRATVISALAEGNSIRSIERMTGVHRDTIMRLGVSVGQACAHVMDVKMRGLDSKQLEVDEIWGFVCKKAKNVRPQDSEQVGDAWTFIALDPDSKAVVTYMVGKRDVFTASAFVYDLSARLKNRVQLSTDSLPAYTGAVALTFGNDGIDYGQIVKTYSPAPPAKAASIRYSPGRSCDCDEDADLREARYGCGLHEPHRAPELDASDALPTPYASDQRLLKEVGRTLRRRSP